MSIAEAVPGGARAAYRKLARVRWITKAKNLRDYEADLPFPEAARYVLWDPEVDNFTYEIANRDELVEWVATALGSDPSRIDSYIDELDDPQFKRWSSVPPARRLWAKPRFLLARRAGWYAVVRETKPEIVVETGMHDGVGSLTFLAALRRNATEGSPGTLLSFDPLPGTGWVVPDELRQWWEPYHEPSDTMTERLAGRKVGVCLHDSLHTYEVERKELETAWEHRADRLVLLTDNAHVTTALADTAAEHELAYTYWREKPARHFYPGGGIGLATAA